MESAKRFTIFLVSLLQLSIHVVSKSTKEKDTDKEKEFAEKVLTLHNRYRKKHDSGPLTLDDELKLKAEKLINTAVIDEGFNVVTAGESVYEVCATFQVIVTPRQVVKSWYDEICQDGVDFKKYDFPQAESFTQLVWKDTQRLGVSKGTGKKGNFTCTYVAAVYRPPGNIEHFFNENVSTGSQDRDKYCNQI